MYLNATDKVLPSDERPARRDGTCFYCSQPLGEAHKAACVIVSKTVVVKVECEVVISVPRDWDAHTIEFARNKSSWCADNLFDDIAEWKDKSGKCMCGTTTISFVRDATEEDHEQLPLLLDDETQTRSEER